MTIAELILPVYDQLLGALDGWIAKAEADPRGDTLLEAKLSEDMFPLARQLRFVCNLPGEALARLGGIAFISSDEDDATLEAARERIGRTRAQISGWRETTLVGEDAPIELALPNGMTFDLDAAQYVRDWALPQFYFHLMTAYSILRAQGIALGKADYVPYMFKYLRAPVPA